MAPAIHPSALIDPGARIGAGCSIGPFAVIGAEVTLHENVTVKSHAVVTGWTEIGPGTTIFPFACVGEVPQDLKYSGERTRLTVGARCRIREGATLNTGTTGGGGITRVGDASDTSPYITDFAVMGVSTGTFIRNMGVLIEAVRGGA